MSQTWVQAEDGNWYPAEAMGWREEHNPWQRFVFWLMGWPHCSAAAEQFWAERKRNATQPRH